jgi:hypothetical protein
MARGMDTGGHSGRKVDAPQYMKVGGEFHGPQRPPEPGMRVADRVTPRPRSEQPRTGTIAKAATPAPGPKTLSEGIAAETRTQHFMFGTTVGSQDDGHRSLARPAPMRQSDGAKGDFFGAHPNEIKLSTMQFNREKAMPHLMEHEKDNSTKTKLVDTGLGRLSDGVERPVKVTKVKPGF